MSSAHTFSEGTVPYCLLENRVGEVAFLRKLSKHVLCSPVFDWNQIPHPAQLTLY